MEFDEQLLPKDLRRLLGHLRGHLEPWESERHSTSHLPIQHITRGGGKADLPWLTEARRRVFEALGNCSSIQYFNEYYLLEHKLTGTEWETLLTPLQFSSSLKELWLLLSSEDDVKLWAIRGKLWGQVLSNSLTVKRVTLRCQRTRGSQDLTEATKMFLSEIVAELRKNLNPAIKYLHIYTAEAIDLIPVAELIQCATNIQSVKLSVRRWSLTDGVKGALVSSLTQASHLCLNELHLRCDDSEGVAEILVKCFAGGPRSRRWLQKLRIECSQRNFSFELWKAISIVSATNIFHIEIFIYYDTDRGKAEWWKSGADFVNSSESDSISVAIIVEPDWDEVFRMESYVKSPPLRSVTVNLNFWERCPPEVVKYCLTKFSEANRSRKVRVTYDVGDTHYYRIKSWATLACSQKFATELTLVGTARPRVDSAEPRVAGVWPSSWNIRKAPPSDDSDLWSTSIHSLRGNTSIKCLDLRRCKLEDAHFKDMMALLQVNFCLEKVELQNTPWENDGKAALIEEALSRNKSQAAYLSVMKEAGLQFEQAKVGRIFLCGSPFAGKTQLKMTMVKSRRGRSRSESKPGTSFLNVRERLKMLELRRTKGAEVELLRDDKKGQVFVWDLAGQYIFRALQDLIFPRINLSCIFVFVFSPFHENTHRFKDQVYDTFRAELEEWLRFVVSDCQIAGHRTPQVLVVLTHRDFTEKHGLTKLDVDLIKKIMGQVRQIFKGVAEVLCEDLYHVDALSKKEVKPLTKFILGLINQLFELRSSGAPLECFGLSSALITRSKSVESSPVWTASTFYKFCRGSQKGLEAVSPEVLHAVALYLHDVGSVIIVPNGDPGVEPWIVVDPNWLTENFLGEMISQGNHFDAQGGGSTLRLEEVVASDGFLDESYFQHLTETISRSKQNEHRSVESSVLEDLMQGLDLCYKIEVDGCQKYFVPTITGGLGVKCDMRRRRYDLHWGGSHMEGCQYLGYRLQCEDAERTSLSAAFFSRFQINFRQKRIKELGIQEGCVVCSLGFMKIRHDGYEVFVESDEITGQYVDILVKSSQVGLQVQREKSQMIKFVKKHLVHELMAFCASPKGCPGIRLVQSIIRTDSVKALLPIHERKAAQHCVKIETLKQGFQKRIEQNLEDVEGDVDMDSLLNFQHSWPTGGTEIARDVLDQADLKDVLMRVRSSLKQTEVHMDLIEVRGILTKLCEASCSNALQFDWSSTQEDERSTLSEEASSSFTNPNSYADLPLTEEGKILASKIDMVGMKVDNLASHIHSEFQQLKNHIKVLKSELRAMNSALTAVNSSIDKTIGYSVSREDHSSPRRPYFTRKDASTGDKMRSYLLLGQAVCLHFMCEARNRPHVVEDQPGFSFVITQEAMSWVPFISNISLKMISVMLEAGIQITTGLGSLVPNLSDLMTGKSIPMSTEDLRHLKLEESRMVNPQEPKTETAWCLLQGFLAKELDGAYGTKFLLHRVRYRASNDPYGWLCRPCVQRGILQRILDACTL